MKKKQKFGISLIILVITIIVIIILAGAVMLNLANNNPIMQATKAGFLEDVRSFQNELTMYQTTQYADKLGSYMVNSLQADENSITYAGVVDTNKTIKDIIPSLTQNSQYNGQFVILNGELVYKGNDSNNQEWAQEIGIKVITTVNPVISMFPKNTSVVKQGINMVYTLEFSSLNAAIASISLTNKIIVLDNNGAQLAVQPVIAIGTLSGTSSDYTRQVDITIDTTNLVSGDYKIKILSGAVTDANSLTNISDTISVTGFSIDNTAPANPIISADVSSWTNGNVTLSIAYSGDSVTKQYSTDGSIWNTYTTPVVITNNITVYAKGLDLSGNESGLAIYTVSKIDKTAPVITYSPNGGSISIITTASDAGGSNINASTLQYAWDIQNTTAPVSGWTTFTNGGTITLTVNGTYYLWVKVSDNAGNSIVTKSNSCTKSGAVSPS